ncbi:MAG: PEP-CTERM sorting domain-containing protein [Opitutales bacterium]
MKHLTLLCALALPLLLQAQSTITIPNAGFETGGAGFQPPDYWEETFPRTTDPGFANSGVDGMSNGLNPRSGSQMLRIGVKGDNDPATSFEGAVNTENPVGTFAADTTYELSAYLARDKFVGSGEWIGFVSLHGDGNEIGRQTVDMNSITEDTWGLVTLTVDTGNIASAVGKDIDVVLGWTQQGDFQQNVFFEDVSLTATSTVIPEPGTYGLVTGVVLLAGLLYRRRRLGA